MASRTRWTWVCVNSGRWWWIGRPGVLRFMGSQRVGHDWAIEQNWKVAQRLKHLPAMWETWVRSLGWQDPLEKEMATHSSTLVWWIPWMEEPAGLQSTGSQRVGHDWVTSLHFKLLLLLSCYYYRLFPFHCQFSNKHQIYKNFVRFRLWLQRTGR